MNQQKPHPFVLLAPLPWKVTLKAAGLLLLLLFVFRFDALRQFSSAFLGGYERDAGLYIWLVQSNCRDFWHLPWFDTLAFYPYSQSLAWSDNFLLPGLAVCPLLKAGVPVSVAYNLLMFAVAFLNGYLTFHLCYRLTHLFLPSFFGGSLLMVATPLTHMLGHPQLQFLFWIPLAILLLLQFLSEQRPHYAVALGFTVCASFLCSIYYAIFIAALIPAIWLWTVLLRGPAFFPWKKQAIFWASLCAGFAPALPFIGPYLHVRDTFSPRALFESYYFSSTILSYFATSPLNWLYHRTSSLSHQEALLFPGFVVYALAAVAFFRLSQGSGMLRRLSLSWLLVFALCAASSSNLLFASERSGYFTAVLLWLSLAGLGYLFFRLGKLEKTFNVTFLSNRALIAIVLGCAFIFFAISLGPLGDPARDQTSLGLFRVLYALFPGYNSIRAVGRAGIIADACLIIAASLGLAYLQRSLKYGRWISLSLLFLAWAEQWHSYYPLQTATPAPPVLEQFPKQPGAMIALPFTSTLDANREVKSWGNFAELNVNYMLWTFPAQTPLVNGYSGQRTNLMKDFPGRTASFPDQTSLSSLSSIAGLRYVLYVSRYVPGFNAASFEERAQAFSPQLELLAKDGENYLFEIRAETRLNKRSMVFVPAHRPAIMQLQLMRPYQEGNPSAPVAVEESFARLALGRFEVPADGTWHEFSAALPARPQQVRPHILSFRLPEDAVYLKAPKVIGAEAEK